PQALFQRGRAGLAEILEREAEALGVAAVPVRRLGDRDGPREHLAHDADDRLGDLLRRVTVELRQQLDAEADVALLVERDVPHALAEAGEDVVALEVVLDHVLAGLGEARLDDDVVERHRRGEHARRPVPAQLAGHPVEAREDLAVDPGQLGPRRGEHPGDGAVAATDDLVQEALEEDAVAGLVGLLGGEEVLLLLARRGVDVGREVVGDRVLAVEEERVEPERAAALLGREPLLPVDAVARQVDLLLTPVAALPARVEVVVGDGVRRWRRGGGAPGSDRHADILSDQPVSARVTWLTHPALRRRTDARWATSRRRGRYRARRGRGAG